MVLDYLCCYAALICADYIYSHFISLARWSLYSEQNWIVIAKVQNVFVVKFLTKNAVFLFAGNKVKGRISKRWLQENKARWIFWKINIS